MLAGASLGDFKVLEFDTESLSVSDPNGKSSDIRFGKQRKIVID